MIEKLRENAEIASQFIVDKIKRELENQGHKATGKLIDSVEAKISGNPDGVTIDFILEKYSIYLDRGVAPNRVNYNPLWLLPWARVIKPSLSESELRKFVFAVRAKHRKEGIPSRGSYVYSKNGRRKNWSKHSIEDNLDEFIELIHFFEFFESYMDEQLAEVL